MDHLVREIRIPVSETSIGLATIELFPVGIPGFITS